MLASHLGRDIRKAAVTAFAVYALVLNALMMSVLMAPQLRADTLGRNLAALEIVCTGNGMGITDAGPGLPGDHHDHQTDCCILCPGAGTPASPVVIELPRRLPVVAALAPRPAQVRLPPSLHHPAARPRGPPTA
ncbi:DUF2946 family protein [Labrys neptuniae]